MALKVKQTRAIESDQEGERTRGERCCGVVIESRPSRGGGGGMQSVCRSTTPAPGGYRFRTSRSAETSNGRVAEQAMDARWSIGLFQGV